MLLDKVLLQIECGIQIKFINSPDMLSYKFMMVFSRLLKKLIIGDFNPSLDIFSRKSIKRIKRKLSFRQVWCIPH